MLNHRCQYAVILECRRFRTSGDGITALDLAHVVDHGVTGFYVVLLKVQWYIRLDRRESRDCVYKSRGIKEKKKKFGRWIPLHRSRSYFWAESGPSDAREFFLKNKKKERKEKGRSSPTRPEPFLHLAPSLVVPPSP